MKFLVRGSILAVFAASAAFASAQSILTTGDSVTTPLLSEPTWTIIDSVTNPYSSTTVSGTLTSIVAKSAATGDNLIFAWVLNASNSSTSSVGRFTTTGWDGWSAAVGQHVATGMASANDVTTADRFNPDVLGFNFDRIGVDSLAPGENSTVFWAISDATSYKTSLANIIDGSVAQVNTYAPVPEPGLMIAAGAGIAAFIARRRKKA